MPKNLFLYFAFIGLLLCSCGTQRKAVYRGGIPPMAKDSASLSLACKIDEFVESLAPHTFNGAIMLEKEGRLILKKGYGYARAENQLPFSTRTLSSSAHLVMQMTAAAILKLSDEEELSLQDSLPLFFKNVPAEKEGIRLEHLLAHTSGLPAELALPPKAVSKNAFLEAMWQAPMGFRPGKGYLYSTAAYRLLAAVVEVASGQEYEEFIRKELIRPAGMENSGYLRNDFEELPIAKSRMAAREEESLYQKYKLWYPEMWSLFGSSGLLSNAEDLFRWEHMLLRGKLLPLELKEALWLSPASLPKEVQAYGWALLESSQQTPILVHESQERGFFCQLLYLPKEKVSLVLLANQVNWQVEQLGEQLVRMVISPQFVPSPLPYVEENLVRLPLEEEARQVRALLSFIQGDSQAEIPELIGSTYSPAFLAESPEHIHLAAINGLIKRLRGARLEHVRQEWPFYYFTFFAPQEKQWYGLRIGVEPQKPHRITSIGLEAIDPIN